MGKYNLAKFFQSLSIILAPLYILRGHFLVPTTFLEILLLITFAITAIDLVREKDWRGRIKSRFNPLIIFFLLSAFLATLMTPDLLGGLGILRAYFIEPVIFFYCLIYTSRKEGNGYIVKSLLAAALWLSVLAFIQKITHQFTLASYELAQGRVSAVFNSANSLALFIGPVSLLCFSLFIKNKQIKKLLFLLFFSFLGVVLVWTRSRGGMVAELIGLIVFCYAVFAKKHSQLKRYWVTLPIIILAGVIFFLYSAFKTYYLSPAQIESPKVLSDTLKIRFYIWAGTLNMLRDHPFFGAGLDGFKTLYIQQYRLPQFNEDFQYPHNLILTFWTETGILGLSAFLLIIVTSFSLVIRNLFKKDLVIGAGLLGALTYIIIHGIVDVPYFKNDLSLEFWTLVALIEFYTRS